MSVAALVLGILSLFFGGIIGTIIGILSLLFAIFALVGKVGKKGLAIAGLVCGSFGTIYNIIYLIVLLSKG